MPLDPAERQWIEDNFGHLFVASQKLSLKLAVAAERIKQTDDRNNTLWAFCIALALGLVASVGTHIFWAGSVDTTLKAQSKQIEDLQGSIRALTKDVQDHERRSGAVKPEQAK
jgi:hypothetical protein